ncbi:FadD32-like long-chain-fatty-acid--AMP ligase [Corynebacterium flavescens]|uniref:FadD32-like long-chain-fatty-acid--AMP ligase n=1 Tax=Corynebacterium flavescens TaxID=28028 RepID=UPI002647794B|nr:FadD32-like long-chain-fatty-acid--AMP ligase [Corynebacterium flavescens]MDN6431756.1 FadD32-like long-chain-fatty-acid--AMP ligase [Corynebacterium flavescens]MDN6475650.1 FadD32-like long-chain-fatty-acid--AMP ligase [Corynebacterium flavescens]MDN6601552.1 FadD32-like long-chain-fatty-acid--AMP ligase [Corynebacterium flavescens]MDN6688337.1 FadD32-like long-chain-fatty-acid--AMP ligase [Corynebacterium flavescens]MDN6822779.1 FadD32-like long-chain-fatty-acid--AMP ligase [Corynebacteri
MDLKALIGQFFDEKGQITLPPHLTLAGLSEHVYQGELQAGIPDRPVMRQWLFDEDRDGKPRDLTRSEVNTRIKVVAARLQQVGTIGDRVAILAGNSPEYLFGFLGALYAGMLPIPLYDPNEPGHADHLKAVFGDANPTIVLTNNPSAAAVREYFAEIPARERPRIISIDSLPDSLAQSWQNPMETEAGRAMAAAATQAPLDQPAFLQYTSGSTRTPAGVVLSNRSILTNVLQIFVGAQLQVPPRVTSWLPLHHDMGIILAAFVTILGLNFEMMTPRDFVQQPKRWVRQLSRQPMDEHLAGTYAVVPNFALELAARYGAPEEGEEFDFSNVLGIIIGSEPVTESALDAFWQTFGEGYGLRREALRPSYGLAEASLIVSTPQRGERPLISHFDRSDLEAGKATIVDRSEDTVAFASNGQTVPAQYLTIVDPETRAEIADGLIGEVWVYGDNMATGYLGRDEETAATFRNQLGERLESGTRIPGAPDDNKWMATGDLGTIVDDQLYITGRLKDLIIIAGRNHYPQDIEGTVQAASEHVRPDSVAAFSVEGDNTEELVILVERADGSDAADDAAATEAIRSAVTKSHGVTPAEIVWKAGHEINRTSSGKIARRVAKKHYEA